MDMNIYFKKSLSGIISSALVLGVVGFGSTSAQAADRGVLNIDCDAADIASTSFTIAGAQVGDTFVIQNTGSTDNCVILPTLILIEETLAGNAGIAPGASSLTETPLQIDDSGTFVVESSGAGGAEFTEVLIDACSLGGLGIPESPWLVSNPRDLKLVGYSGFFDSFVFESCTLSGSYLQTANISGVDTSEDESWLVEGTFTGSYDGDHYSITYDSGGVSASYAGRNAVFEVLGVGGEIKRLSLTGHIKSSTTRNASLVEVLAGGLISEVKSSVFLDVSDSDAIIGGLVGEAGDVADTDQRIQYSSYTGRIYWEDDTTNSEGPTIGGLVGIVRDDGVTEIRDSYSRATISYNSGSLDADPEAAIYAGGLVGSDGDNELADEDLDGNGGDREHSPSGLTILRSYFAGSFSNTCLGTPSECRIDIPSHVFTGGLIGVSSDLNNTGDIIASAFWLSSSVSNAVGQIVDGGDQPNGYSVEALPEVPGSLPEAPGLSTSFLTTLSTYQSEEGAEPGLPSAESDLLVANSALGDLSEQDYRWAIEAGSVGTFVPSSYSNESEFSSRELFTDTTVPQSYRVRGAGDLLVHGGADSEIVTGYPSLGRVWEICTNENNGFPVLVWEERTCSGGGSAAGGNPGGLSDAEYAEFLRSGLTLEQFLARRLAATGAPAEALGQGLIVAALLAAAGLGLILGRRRLRSGNSL
jgi:hypothetical protein